MGNRFAFTAAVSAIALVLTAACTVHQTEPPALMGPSDFSLSVDVAVTPDSISQDGASQSSVTVTAHGPNGAVKAGVTLRLDMEVGGVIQDFGTLSARTVVTGSDGRASAIYTAPAASPTAGGAGTFVSILAKAIGTNAQVGDSRSASIRLVPPGVILPPAGTPTAAFTVSPTPVVANVAAIFDASTSQVGAGALQINSYSWDFGDGRQGTGRTLSHTFRLPGTFNVSLTIVNDRSVAASTTVAVTVGSLPVPVARFVFSPTAPTVNQLVQFNADQSTAAPGHRLTAASWNFGDGSRVNGFVVAHAFTTAGAYNVVLTVTDDTGQDAVTSSTVSIGGGAGGGGATPPTPRFVFSPSAPGVNQDVFFNASSSTPGSAGHSITSYSWDFGDGNNGTGATTTHPYGRSGTFTVTLLVTDDTGQSATTSSSVTVSVASSQIVADFNFSPTDPKIGTGTNRVFFDATASSSPSTITTYVWDFGDGSATTVGSGQKPNHLYTLPATYVVRLTVTDSAGRTATVTKTVTVGS